MSKKRSRRNATPDNVDDTNFQAVHDTLAKKTKKRKSKKNVIHESDGNASEAEEDCVQVSGKQSSQDKARHIISFYMDYKLQQEDAALNLNNFAKWDLVGSEWINGRVLKKNSDQQTEVSVIGIIVDQQTNQMGDKLIVKISEQDPNLPSNKTPYKPLQSECLQQFCQKFPAYHQKKTNPKFPGNITTQIIELKINLLKGQKVVVKNEDDAIMDNRHASLKVGQLIICQGRIWSYNMSKDGSDFTGFSLTAHTIQIVKAGHISTSTAAKLLEDSKSNYASNETAIFQKSVSPLVKLKKRF